MYICKRKRGGTYQNTHPINKLKKFFDMVKDTKSSPISKRNGAKKISFTEYQLITNKNLTAMP
jgi:hypothetical protein